MSFLCSLLSSTLLNVCSQNRQSYSQLLGDVKTSSFKPRQVRTTGRGRGKGDNKPAIKNVKAKSALVKEKSHSMGEILKAFSIRFIRLNGILFTRTRLD